MILVVNSMLLINNLKLRFNEQICRNLLKRKTSRRLRRPGVTCINNVKIKLAVV